jgi:uncharacterized protein YhfF
VNETISTDNFSELPISEFAFPGPLRDRLICAILDGRKVTTTSLALEYEIGREPLPCVGQRSVVVDSNSQPVCVIETMEVLIVPLGEVGYDHVVDEGEGHETVSEWRAGHKNFWRSKEMTDSLGDSTFILDDATLVVLERFRVIERLRSTAN